jgi:hypothetical protein
MKSDPAQLVDGETMEPIVDVPIAVMIPALPPVPVHVPAPPPVPILANVPVIEDIAATNNPEPLAAVTADDATTVAANPRVIRELNRLGATLSDVPWTEHRSLRSGRDDISLLPDSATTTVDVGYIFSDFSLLVHEWFGSPALVNVDVTKMNPSQYKDHFYIPKTFEEAWYHDCPFQRKLWREAIMNKVDKMKLYGVYKVIKRAKIPQGRKCVKHKWVFDIKRNGIFRARLVACGYSQQPGVDFTDTYSPVINDAVFRLILIIQMVYKLVGMIIDIELHS